MRWSPHVTVAAIIERRGKYLFVHENTTHGPVLNQPAGHLEDTESLQDAIRREVMEETGYQFNPQSLVGIYQYRAPDGHATYLRFAYAGDVAEPGDGHELDPIIIETLWLSRAELESNTINLRSPLVIQTLDDYESGQRYPLDIIEQLV
jgi:8-oxo-dGTP pyrophosphatase MutT (NUDIX family)